MHEKLMYGVPSWVRLNFLPHYRAAVAELLRRRVRARARTYPFRRRAPHYREAAWARAYPFRRRAPHYRAAVAELLRRRARAYPFRRQLRSPYYCTRTPESASLCSSLLCNCPRRRRIGRTCCSRTALLIFSSCC
jgi:hypothetical protein